jgi:hypothetical protein
MGGLVGSFTAMEYTFRKFVLIEKDSFEELSRRGIIKLRQKGIIEVVEK